VPTPTPAATEVEGLLRVDAPGLMQRITSTTTRGTVVSVWATWCGSCRREIPMYLELRKLFLPSGIDFVFISADEPPAFASVVEQMRAWGGPLPALAVGGSMGRFMRGIDPRWHGALPATFLFDATPKLRHFWEGPIYEHEITPILQGYLAGEPIDGETRPPITGGPPAP
jgi:thiol-disulfide isomerase/thioredoxin